jgi:hypothetical protein
LCRAAERRAAFRIAHGENCGAIVAPARATRSGAEIVRLLVLVNAAPRKNTQSAARFRARLNATLSAAGALSWALAQRSILHSPGGNEALKHRVEY